MKKLLIILDGLMEEYFEDKDLGSMVLGPLSNCFRVNRVNYSVPGYDVDSLNCIMNILGYSPKRYNLSDRAYYEGLSRGIENYKLIMRCNVVRIEKGVLVDFAGGNLPHNISNIVEGFKIESGRVHSCIGYKNLITLDNDEGVQGEGLCPPHFNIGNNVIDIMPRDSRLKAIVEESKGYFNSIGLNGLALWPWGIAQKPDNLGNHNDTGIISGIDLVHGIGIHLGMDSVKPIGATGDVDTDLSAKLIATLSSIKNNNRTILHVNGLDEVAHRRDLQGKLELVSRLQRDLITPLIENGLRENIDIIITSDHRTDSKTGEHNNGYVQYFSKEK
ncbi:MAG: hypothetical protein RR838_00745 [Clostridium sp.]